MRVVRVVQAFDLDNYVEVACKIHQVNPAWTVQQKDHFIRHAMREFKIHQGRPRGGLAGLTAAPR